MSCTRYAAPYYRKAALDPASWIHRHVRAGYLVQCALASPVWVDRKALAKLAAEARLRTLLTGREHTLDHIVPLNHRYVCGLNVPWNLRIIERGPNMAKSNHWHPDQGAFAFGESTDWVQRALL